MENMIVKKAALDKIDIVQRNFGNNSTGEISKLFGDDYCSNMDNNNGCHYFIYINEPIPIVLLHISGANGLLERTSFFPDLKKVLLQLPKLNFDSILFVLSNYMVFDKVDPIGLIQKSAHFSSIPAYDDLLSSTYGYLFYKHQLEQLISRVSTNSEINPIELRKAWNKKIHKTIAELYEMKLVNGTSLTDFIKARTIEKNHFLWSPQFNGTQILWNYLIK